MRFPFVDDGSRVAVATNVGQGVRRAGEITGRTASAGARTRGPWWGSLNVVSRAGRGLVGAAGSRRRAVGQRESEV